MKNLFIILGIGVIGSVAYFSGSGSCGFSPASLNAAPTTAAAPAEAKQDSVPAGWTTDYEAALKQAKAENKSVLIDFTGSDWCGWCIKLDREVFSQPAFKEYAQKDLVRVYIDFPRGKPQSDALKEKNKELAEKFGVQGLPTIVILNSEGQMIGKTGYQRGGAENYVEHLQEIISDKKDS